MKNTEDALCEDSSSQAESNDYLNDGEPNEVLNDEINDESNNETNNETNPHPRLLNYDPSILNTDNSSSTNIDLPKYESASLAELKTAQTGLATRTTDGTSGNSTAEYEDLGQLIF